MKKIILFTIGLFSFFGSTFANNNLEKIDTNLCQKDIRHQQKQEIKSDILSLYEDLKLCEDRNCKKDKKNQIFELKKNLRKINGQIMYSYKKQIKNLFTFK